jgi:hypothetical protein
MVMGVGFSHRIYASHPPDRVTASADTAMILAMIFFIRRENNPAR